MQKPVDKNIWYIGKEVVVCDLHMEKLQEAVVTKVGIHYITVLGKRFRVGNSPILKEIGYDKTPSPLKVCSKETFVEIKYISDVVRNRAMVSDHNKLLELSLIIGDKLNVERPKHLVK